jgi:very-short-patch-repair endonuclease
VAGKRDTVRRARHLRRTMSLPEVLLWQRLKGSPDGVAFRKQHPVGAYVLDFYCAAAKTGIEVDGIAHDMGDRPQRDARRDMWLAAQGIQVVRIAAAEVLADPDGVAEGVIALSRKR